MFVTNKSWLLAPSAFSCVCITVYLEPISCTCTTSPPVPCLVLSHYNWLPCLIDGVLHSPHSFEYHVLHCLPRTDQARTVACLRRLRKICLENSTSRTVSSIFIAWENHSSRFPTQLEIWKNGSLRNEARFLHGVHSITDLLVLQRPPRAW